jgi:hypothetical protein
LARADRAGGRSCGRVYLEPHPRFFIGVAVYAFSLEHVVTYGLVFGVHGE